MASQERAQAALLESQIRRLLIPSVLENVELYDKDIALLTMHDLVHDLARSVMDDEILVVSKGDNVEGSCYHYALLDDCSKPLVSELSKIRALRFMKCDKIKLHDAAFSSANSLRVLDLSECIIHKLPDSIGVLKQLRYLNAPGVQHTTIPDSITKLSKLMYLDIHGSTAIVELPESIGDTEGLVYINLSGCSELTKLPESFRKLQKLVHLDLSNCSSVGGISVLLGNLTQLQYLNVSDCPNIGDIPEVLGGLSQLQYLNLSFSSYQRRYELKRLPDGLGEFIQLKYSNLSGCSHLAKLFGGLKSLVHLDLSYCHMDNFVYEVLVDLTNLQYLNLKGTCLSSLPVGLTKIRYLNLSHLINMTRYMFDSLINHICSNLADLEHLNLSYNLLIISIPESLCSLRKLHTLDLKYCINLQKLPSSIGAIESLKFLHLEGCYDISEPPQLGGSAVSLPHFAVQPGNNDSGSTLVRLQQVDPHVLQISKLENVKSVGEAQRIKLMEKKNLYDLKLKWSRDAQRFVDDRMLLEKLVPPSRLKRLEICDYNGVSFPAWLERDQLPNLEHLVLRGMSNLKEWNTSYTRGEKHMLDILEVRDCPLLRMIPLPPKAKEWVISKSDNVFTSCEDYIGPHINASSSSSAVPAKLSLQYCNMPLHKWIQHFPGLSYLSITSCGDLTGSPQTSQHLSSLQTLHIEGSLEELPEWISDLQSLQFLSILCERLKGLKENMRQLTNLESLELNCCESMVSLPHWLGELTSLRLIYLYHCDVLRSLPESIQQLTGLKKLEIYHCPKLKHVVELEEGKMNLAHNKERLCLLPSSLEELRIRYCDGIKSLPEGMEQLTNLQILSICSCPELEKWCRLEENKMKLAHIKDQSLF